MIKNVGVLLRFYNFTILYRRKYSRESDDPLAEPDDGELEQDGAVGGMEEEDLVELLALLLAPAEVEDAELRPVARGRRREPHPRNREPPVGGSPAGWGRRGRKRGARGEMGATARPRADPIAGVGSSPGEDGREIRGARGRDGGRAAGVADRVVGGWREAAVTAVGGEEGRGGGQIGRAHV